MPYVDPNPEVWTGDDWTQCFRLLKKAHRLGMYDEVLESTSDPDFGFIKVPDDSDLGHSMSDATKRAREGPAFVPKTKAYIAPVAPKAPMVYERSLMTHDRARPGPDDYPVPPGLTSLAEWGRCAIPFGKLKNKMSYNDLFEKNDEVGIDYKIWLCQHYENGSAHLRDLVSFLRAKGDVYATHGRAESSQGIVIPGTSVTRRFMWWKCNVVGCDHFFPSYSLEGVFLELRSWYISCTIWQPAISAGTFMATREKGAPGLSTTAANICINYVYIYTRYISLSYEYGLFFLVIKIYYLEFCLIISISWFIMY